MENEFIKYIIEKKDEEFYKKYAEYKKELLKIKRDKEMEVLKKNVIKKWKKGF